MKTYENKEELKNEIEKSFQKYILEFDSIPENLKDKRVEEVDNFWAGLFSDMYNELLVTVVAINFMTAENILP